MKRIIFIWITFALLLTSCSSSQPAPTMTATSVPTNTPIPTTTVTPVPMIEVDGIQVPDPKSTNPELFDLTNPDSPIVQFANAFETKPQEVGELTPRALTGVDAKQYIIQVTNDLVSTNNYNELGTALIIAEQGIAGYWTWRPTTLKDTEKATGIEQGILLNLSPKAQPITAVQFKFGVSYIGWPYTEALQNQFTFGDSDYDYDFAKQHNMEVGGHMLIWGFDTPDWVRQKSNSPDILRQIMINHIDQIVGQYKGRTNYWVVVNEAGAKSQSSGYSDVFLNSLGEQYIFDAFQEVREKDPSAKLVYGDYLNYFNKDESRKIFIIDLVLKLKQRGLIDALGLQIYGRMDNKDLLEKLKIDLHDLRQLGIPIYINEFSVVMLRESSQESMLTQAEVTKKIIITLKESGIVTKIVHWGLSDDLTNKISGNQANAGLFMLNGSTNQLVPKPNFFAILSTLNESNQ